MEQLPVCGGSAECVDFEGYEEHHKSNATGAWPGLLRRKIQLVEACSHE
jgi:hypothetical protein